MGEVDAAQSLQERAHYVTRRVGPGSRDGNLS